MTKSPFSEWPRLPSLMVSKVERDVSAVSRTPPPALRACVSDLPSEEAPAVAHHACKAWVSATLTLHGDLTRGMSEKKYALITNTVITAITINTGTGITQVQLKPSMIRLKSVPFCTTTIKLAHKQKLKNKRSTGLWAYFRLEDELRRAQCGEADAVEVRDFALLDPEHRAVLPLRVVFFGFVAPHRQHHFHAL